MALSDYRPDPGQNLTISGIDIAGGCPPGGINNAIRQLMTDLASGVGGVARSVKDGSFKPRRLCLWLVKLTTYGLCLGVVGALNGAAEHSWGLKLPLLDTVLVILIAGEAVSIFENLHGMGCQVPPVLFRLAAGVKSKAGKKLDALLDDDGGGNGE